MKYLQILALSVWMICFYSVAQANPWDITEEMMLQMTEAIPMLEKTLSDKSPPCIKSLKMSRLMKEKGFVVEVIYKQGICIDIVLLHQQMLAKLKAQSGMIHWFQRGFFLEYIYKGHDGKKIGEFRIDREALFGKSFSQHLESAGNSEYQRIILSGKTLSFLVKDMQIPEFMTPGYPMTHRYCNIDFNQELYFFRNKEISLSFSVISLSNSLPNNKQLQCISEGDFAIQKKSPETYRIDTSVKKNGLLKPVYKIIEYTGKKEEIVYALSSLVGNNTAIYFVFSGSNNAANQKLIDDIIDSVRLEDELTSTREMGKVATKKSPKTEQH
jgi:hypothetical protein